MVTVAAIMPCRGRVERTIQNLRRLLATAGSVEWRLVCVTDGDDAVVDAIACEQIVSDIAVHLIPVKSRVRYWGALREATMHRRHQDATHLVNLANDLLPGRDWLVRGLAAYRARFGDGDGLMGFNDGIHGPEHSPHFLISRRLLDRYGGWPVWYRHNYGDTELCQRAQVDGCYGKAPWALLYHDHELTGASHDEVYAEGTATSDQDRALFEERRRRGWPKAH